MGGYSGSRPSDDAPLPKNSVSLVWYVLVCAKLGFKPKIFLFQSAVLRPVCGPMRRKAGVAGIQANATMRQQMKEHGQALSEASNKSLMQQMEVFREKLEAFAVKHKHEINRNPEFRHHFHKMCVTMGVDPLASKKGFWSELLGYGDFYYELAVQAIEVCLSTRKQNGGLMPLKDVTLAVMKRRPGTAQVSRMALSPLGGLWG